MVFPHLFGHRGGMVCAVLVGLSLSAGCGQSSDTQASAAAETTPDTDAPLLKNPIALQLYSLRESFKADGVPATLAKVQAMGITHVELAGTYGLSREEFKAELDKAGLTPVSMHTDINALIKNPAPVVDDAKFYGLRYVGNAWFPHERPFDAEDAARAIESFNTAGRLLHEAGLTFFYHAHGFEFAPAPGGGTLFDTIVTGTDPDLVKFQLDVFWAYHGWADPVELLRRYPTRFVSTHLKDMQEGTERNFTGSAPDETSVALGSGVIDIKGVLEAARGTSVEWHIIEEESHEPEKNIPAGLAYVRRLEDAERTGLSP
jgi:sugar phosphate isomerase/epimerase